MGELSQKLASDYLKIAAETALLLGSTHSRQENKAGQTYRFFPFRDVKPS